MSISALVSRNRTGEKCEVLGQYDFDGYLDNTRQPEPRPEEQSIALARMDTFPPIRSSGRGCYWKLADRR